ncbi:MAG: hypothetical protein IIU58_02780 [Clostridia bacterium]|nr:hypothetical protein [Clostridia bacterium]
MSKPLTLLVAFLGSSAATAIVQAIIAFINEKRSRNDGMKNGMRYLLKRDLEQRGNAMLDGGVTYAELKDWEKEHSIYHNGLGGNGDLDPLHQALTQSYLKNPKGE